MASMHHQEDVQTGKHVVEKVQDKAEQKIAKKEQEGDQAQSASKTEPQPNSFDEKQLSLPIPANLHPSDLGTKE